MKFNTLTINGTDYQYHQQYLKDDGLWECTYVDAHTNIAEVASGNLVTYDELLGTAKKDLDMLIKGNALEFGVDNEVIIWKYLDAETQRKIKVKAHSLKMELLGEWDTEENRYAKWRKYMHAYCGIWFPKCQYDWM